MRWLQRRRQVNVTYHNVLTDSLFDHSLHLGVSLPEHVFQAQIKHLAARYRITTTPNTPGTCRITFDDGYLNQIQLASSILERHNVRGVFFITFGMVGTGEMLIIDRLLIWISYVPAGTYKIFNNTIEITCDNRLKVFRKLYDVLLSDSEKWSQVPRELEKAFAFHQLPIKDEMRTLRTLPLSPSDIQQLRKNGHRIGYHFLTHRPLATLSDSELIEECSGHYQHAGSLDLPIECSYPFGGINEVSLRVLNACKEKGMSYGYLNTEAIPKEFLEYEHLAFPRVSLGFEKTPYVLDAKLTGLESWLKRLLGQPNGQ